MKPKEQTVDVFTLLSEDNTESQFSQYMRALEQKDVSDYVLNKFDAMRIHSTLKLHHFKSYEGALYILERILIPGKNALANATTCYQYQIISSLLDLFLSESELRFQQKLLYLLLLFLKTNPGQHTFYLTSNTHFYEGLLAFLTVKELQCDLLVLDIIDLCSSIGENKANFIKTEVPTELVRRVKSALKAKKAPGAKKDRKEVSGGQQVIVTTTNTIFPVSKAMKVFRNMSTQEEGRTRLLQLGAFSIVIQYCTNVDLDSDGVYLMGNLLLCPEVNPSSIDAMAINVMALFQDTEDSDLQLCCLFFLRNFLNRASLSTKLRIIKDISFTKWWSMIHKTTPQKTKYTLTIFRILSLCKSAKLEGALLKNIPLLLEYAKMENMAEIQHQVFCILCNLSVHGQHGVELLQYGALDIILLKFAVTQSPEELLDCISCMRNLAIDDKACRDIMEYDTKLVQLLKSSGDGWRPVQKEVVCLFRNLCLHSDQCCEKLMATNDVIPLLVTCLCSSDVDILTYTLEMVTQLLKLSHSSSFKSSLLADFQNSNGMTSLILPLCKSSSDIRRKVAKCFHLLSTLGGKFGLGRYDHIDKLEKSWKEMEVLAKRN